MRKFRVGEDGFSLTEIMVVVLIIGVLVGIGLPTYLGMRKRAQETAAKDSAAIAVKTAKTFATDGAEDFSLVTTAALNTAEPSRTFIDGNLSSSGPNEISQMVPDAGTGDQIFVAAVESDSEECFYSRTFAAGGSDFGRVLGTDCRADDHGSVIFGPSW